MMIFQRKYGWWKKNNGLEQSKEDKKKDAVSKKVWMMKKNHGFEQIIEDKKK